MTLCTVFVHLHILYTWVNVNFVALTRAIALLTAVERAGDQPSWLKLDSTPFGASWPA